ncbi:MAG: ABC transporter ATP-binding protein [Candidatus Kariarchaeaceae archaeon]|jgi:oligopeptide/dipeptide ABC transporter ATP-binding protein
MVHFHTEAGTVEALDGVDFDIGYNEAVGIVGESGCGKTVTSHAVLRILPDNGQIVDGQIIYKGHDLLDLNERQMRKVRGSHIALTFQDPMSSLNPVFKVSTQMIDVISLHQDCDEEAAREIAISQLKAVGIPDAKKRIDDYPHQFSGGMRQRILIARAFALEPTLLIADEPTTALDVTIQAQVLEIIKGLRKRFGLSLMLITHNLGVVFEITDRVHIFYGGNVVESGITKEIFTNPRHPYTKLLLLSIPSLDEERETLQVIKGNVPQLINPPKGCRFNPRCDFAKDICKDEKPKLEVIEGYHRVACHFWDEVDFSIFEDESFITRNDR